MGFLVRLVIFLKTGLKYGGITALSDREMILKINNIEVKYHEVILVIKGVSIEVPKGEIVALLGANGAGKSTTLKAVSGLLNPDNGKVTDGSIEFMGERIDKIPAEKIAKKGIVQVIEGRRVFEHLGYKVVRLDRVMFASLTKKDIPRGKWRKLTEKEVNMLKMLP